MLGGCRRVTTIRVSREGGETSKRWKERERERERGRGRGREILTSFKEKN